MFIVWPVPTDVCERNPELKPYGLYRKLNDGRWEFISYCSLGKGELKDHEFFAIFDNDLNNILNKTLPK